MEISSDNLRGGNSFNNFSFTYNGVDENAKFSYLVFESNREGDDKQWKEFIQECVDNSEKLSKLGLKTQEWKLCTVDGKPAIQMLDWNSSDFYGFGRRRIIDGKVSKQFSKTRDLVFKRPNPRYLSLDEWEKVIVSAIPDLEKLRAADLVTGLPETYIAFDFCLSELRYQVRMYFPFCSVTKPSEFDEKDKTGYYHRVFKRLIEAVVWEILLPFGVGMSQEETAIYEKIVKHFSDKYGI